MLKEKIENKTAVIGVVGLGYVGIPLAVEFADKGFKTIGIDIDTRKVNALNAGENYIKDIADERVRSLVGKKVLSARADFTGVGACDVVFICVPTPFTVNKDPDISYIVSATREIAKELRRGQLIILKSTTFPGTTSRYMLPILEETGLKCGTDFYLAFSPERIDPGNTKWTTENTPIVVGGITPACTDLAVLVTRQIVSLVHPVSSAEAAEMTKLLENVFRSVNIALVNELAMLCERAGNINVWEVVRAAATKPFGFMPFYPGPGIGGHCILIDPYYLSWYAREFDFHTDFIELAARTNENMPFYVKSIVVDQLAQLPLTAKSARILVLGAAFKANVDDTRHSPSLRVMELLMADGYTNLAYNDPHVPVVTVEHKEYRSEPLTTETISSADVIVVGTNHAAYDWKMILGHAKLVIDTRNATAGFHNDRVRLLGNRAPHQ